MNYYMYNHKADEIPMPGVGEGEKKKYCFPLMHYCEHCHTDIVGVWEFYGVITPVAQPKLYDEDYIRMGFQTGYFFDTESDARNYIKSFYDSFHGLSNTDKVKIKNSKKILLPIVNVHKDIKKYREEYDRFAEMKKCPLCGRYFSDNFKYHLGTLHQRMDRTGFYSGRYHRYLYDFVPREEIYCKKEPWKMYFFSPAENNLYMGKAYTGINSDSADKYVNCHEWTSRYPYDNSSVDALLNFFKSLRFSECEEYVQNKHNCYVKKCDISIPAKRIGNDSKNVDFKKYLSNLISLEKNIYSVSERLKELYQLEFFADQEAVSSAYMMSYTLLKEKPTPQSLLDVYNNLIEEDITKNVRMKDIQLDYHLSEPKKPKKPCDKPEKPVLETPGFFNKKKINEKNALLTAAYEEKLRKYDEEYRKYEQALEEFNVAYKEYNKVLEAEYTARCEKAKQEHQQKCEMAKADYEKCLEEYNAFTESVKDFITPEKAKQSLIKQEIAQAEELLEKLYHARNELYAYDIVFIKYRNLVAISTFYEYIMSGRCETLEGASGAYNIYENEIRMNTVISQLSDVVASLEEIKNNQFMIYSAITEINLQLSELNYSMDSAVKSLERIKTNTSDMNKYLSEISDNTKVIAYNTEATAFYAKKNAELTNALGYMVALS